ncbi:ISC system 2Fe-2S type ferredoxin [Buchnera aphidicola (Thelaxes californica)]|uniref:2Fe-2S ferredoxin n=1 Tax=Buchnera aphidicola (Thelaxes californica) TaxID=1315998 RepID=A0A4D6YLY7_9GAMM|nr:ISC system 2Fe-2S type ferredoxin [Buchnera aphidicola]QCI26984.1 ISC system 2Fe-2S type ferredoxin [Buchnera aphidicola (Thelaxes californica)]
MTTITFILNKKNKIEKKNVTAKNGETILDVALKNNIYIEHACEKSCVCTTCHCIIKKGFLSLSTPSEKEEDTLDKAWGIQENSRLSCQAKIGNKNITVEIPQYSLNYSNKSS